jgi:hypothetical protein
MINERDAIAAIVKFGGSVMYSGLSKEPSGSKWLRNLLGDNFFSQVRVVYLNGARDGYLPRSKVYRTLKVCMSPAV